MGRMRAVVNPHRDPNFRSSAAPAGVRAFHASLPGYAPTPLVRRTDLAEALGIRDLYVKYEGTRLGLMAFKGLGASWAIERLLRAGSGSMTVATASEGNHGRAVAWSARHFGLPCVIFLPAHAAAERIDNIRREGARVDLVEGTYEDAVRRCDEVSRREGWQVVSDVGYEGYMDIPLLVVDGYSTLYQEIDEQLAARGLAEPDVWLIPGGVGGILHAGVAHLRAARAPELAIVAVEPSEGDCLTTSIESPGGVPAVSTGSRCTAMACLNCAEVSLPSWPAIRSGVDVFAAIDDAWAEDAVRRLCHAASGAESIAAGTSGAAATGGLFALLGEARFQAARNHLRLGSATVALAVCTEGPIDRADFERVIRAR